MGRPPCCEKVRFKKGLWRPEEDIILVSYIQEHGPGNWRSVSVNTGLMRNSESCRLRWTNHLRPGIRRGNLTPHEEGIIVQLQSLLGNRWAAIASYIPQRTDSDIKNYWHTRLKKKLNKQETMSAISAPLPHSKPSIIPTIPASHVDRHHDRTTSNSLSKDSYAYARRPASSNPADEEVAQLIAQCSYASRINNIPNPLDGFMNSSLMQGDATDIKPSSVIDNNPLFPFDHMSGGAPISDVPPLMPPPPSPPPPQQQQQLSSIEDWLFDDVAEQVVH